MSRFNYIINMLEKIKMIVLKYFLFKEAKYDLLVVIIFVLLFKFDLYIYIYVILKLVMVNESEL